jgi:hypothetical protein
MGKRREKHHPAQVAVAAIGQALASMVEIDSNISVVVLLGGLHVLTWQQGTAPRWYSGPRTRVTRCQWMPLKDIPAETIQKASLTAFSFVRVQLFGFVLLVTRPDD